MLYSDLIFKMMCSGGIGIPAIVEWLCKVDLNVQLMATAGPASDDGIVFPTDPGIVAVFEISDRDVIFRYGCVVDREFQVDVFKVLVQYFLGGGAPIIGPERIFGFIERDLICKYITRLDDSGDIRLNAGEFFQVLDRSAECPFGIISAANLGILN